MKKILKTKNLMPYHLQHNYDVKIGPKTLIKVSFSF